MPILDIIFKIFFFLYKILKNDEDKIHNILSYCQIQALNKIKNLFLKKKNK